MHPEYIPGKDNQVADALSRSVAPIVPEADKVPDEPTVTLAPTVPEFMANVVPSPSAGLPSRQTFIREQKACVET